jgi:NAD(P)-dependent dehydrogenase (short-subunit alcohol dehydrogenase family)
MTTPDAEPLAGRTVLVIGGTSGIGKAVARQAAGLGATVTVTGRDSERLARSARHSWISATAELDAHDDDGIEHFFDHTEPVDHVVSLVGDSMAGGFLNTPPELMRHVWQSKFWANWRIGQHAARSLRPGGSMIFTAGTGGRPHEVSATYVSNLAIHALVEGLAVELAPEVRVNAVAPTFLGTATRFWSHLPAEDVGREETRFSAMVPLRRLATVTEVASAYVHLMANTYITGQVLAVDGGVMLTK